MDKDKIHMFLNCKVQLYTIKTFNQVKWTRCN